MTVCHHGLHNGVMAYILNIGETTMQRIFVAWVVFIEAVFSKINLKPDEGFLAYNMPEIFVKTGHVLTDIVIDCKEFKLQQPSNYDLSPLTSSNYKNTQEKHLLEFLQMVWNWCSVKYILVLSLTPTSQKNLMF